MNSLIRGGGGQILFTRHGNENQLGGGGGKQILFMRHGNENQLLTLQVSAGLLGGVGDVASSTLGVALNVSCCRLGAAGSVTSSVLGLAEEVIQATEGKVGGGLVNLAAGLVRGVCTTDFSWKAIFGPLDLSVNSMGWNSHA